MKPIRAVLVAIVCVCVAHAEQYWVTYDASTGVFPEEVGWTRYASDPPAQRWFGDGNLFIDSRASRFIYDQCAESRPGLMTPGPGEMFDMRWRVKVDEVIGYTDPGVAVRSDDQHYISITLGNDFVDVGACEPVTVPLEPGYFHSFEFQSNDMSAFRFYVDGQLATTGLLVDSLFTTPVVALGDMTSDCSLAEWDYFEYGIVPEPGTIVCCLAAIGTISRGGWRVRLSIKAQHT